MVASGEHRSLERMPCCIQVSNRAQSSPLGEIQNISLDGLFIATTAPLPHGSVVPLTFTLEDGKPIRADAEVVRITDGGMGMRFLRLEKKDARQLRRHIVDLIDTLGKRNTVARLEDVAGRTVEPITDKTKVAAKFTDSESSDTTVIPANRSERCKASLRAVGADSLGYASEENCSLRPGEEVFALFSHDFVSYSFRTSVVSVDGRTFSLRMPEVLQYSERRSDKRTSQNTDATISFQVPWNTAAETTWPVLERSTSGLSFRANSREAYFWPGTRLPDPVLRENGGTEVLANATVKHLTAMPGPDGEEFLRVGVSFGMDSTTRAVVSEEMANKRPRSLLAKTRAWMANQAAKVSYLYHSRMPKHSQRLGGEFSVVRFANQAGKPLVGLLNLAFEDEERPRVPLVIVAPGFGGRKEAMSALALTLVDNFRRNHRNVAVLRFDGTNNLGESYKNPGCEGEGKHNLQFTISDGINDLLGALAWAKNNRYLDPTNIVLITVSFSSIAARRVLTMPEAASVGTWISFMGAADAANAIMHVSGNVDIYGNYVRGIKTGVIALIGCLTDTDNFSRDMFDLKVATLEDARRDMATIKADITWVIGKHDGFMDSRRVHSVMEVKAGGQRNIIEVDAGHVPRSSDEALAEFSLMTRHVWRALYGQDLNSSIPSRGWLAAVSKREWERVRQTVDDSTAWWRDYLLGEGGLGYDVWALVPEYKELVATQVAKVPSAATRVLDLGAGTGNISEALAHKGIAELHAVDLVAEALERVTAKTQPGRVKTMVASAEGSAVTAMRRWLAGHYTGFREFSRHMPAPVQDSLEAIAQKYTANLHAVSRGAGVVSAAQALREAGLPATLAAVLEDLNTLARFCRGLIDQKSALSMMRPSMLECLQGTMGLPYADNTFDAIVCSLVLSYLKRPEDALFEAHRILRPGGTLVISSLLPDMDGSKTFVQTIEWLEKAREDELPPGHSREELVKALRAFFDHGSQLFRLEEEGVFAFWDGPTLSAMVAQAGFEQVTQTLSYGTPPGAVIVTCVKP